MSKTKQAQALRAKQQLVFGKRKVRLFGFAPDLSQLFAAIGTYRPDIVGRKGGYGLKAAVPANQWHALRVEFAGTRFKVIFNGQPLFEVEDATFTEPGMVGLWTKADSVTAFSAFTYGDKK